MTAFRDKEISVVKRQSTSTALHGATSEKAPVVFAFVSVRALEAWMVKQVSNSLHSHNHLLLPKDNRSVKVTPLHFAGGSGVSSSQPASRTKLLRKPSEPKLLRHGHEAVHHYQN
jgi:hypothetical protein